jgi:phosphoribosylglycinamide formyltransferase-1
VVPALPGQKDPIVGCVRTLTDNHGPVRLAVLGSGAGTTAAYVMGQAGVSVRAEVCLAISNNERSGLLEHARTHRVPALHLSAVTHPGPTDRDDAMVEALDGAGAEIVVLAGYLKKVGPRTLQRWAGSIVNTHPALLPAYGGLGMYGDHVHRAVLADSATVTGASIHLVTPEYDEGRVLSQVAVPVKPGDDVASLRSRVQAAEKALLLDWLIKRCGGTSQVPSSGG